MSLEIWNLEGKLSLANSRIEILERTFMCVIQIDNLCEKTGIPCRSDEKCGCALEMEIRIEEIQERIEAVITEQGSDE